MELLRSAYLSDPFNKLTKEQINVNVNKIYNLLKKKYDDDEVLCRTALIATHLSKLTYTGYYSLVLNSFLRRCTLEDDLLELFIYMDHKGYYPELYNNTKLTNEERVHIQKLANAEYCKVKKSLNDDGEVNADLVCTYQPNFDQTVDTFCIPLIDMLKSLILGCVNPITGKRYDQRLVDVIVENFSTELKLVKYSCKHSKRVRGYCLSRGLLDKKVAVQQEILTGQK